VQPLRAAGHGPAGRFSRVQRRPAHVRERHGRKRSVPDQICDGGRLRVEHIGLCPRAVAVESPGEGLRAGMRQGGPVLQRGLLRAVWRLHAGGTGNRRSGRGRPPGQRLAGANGTGRSPPSSNNSRRITLWSRNSKAIGTAKNSDGKGCSGETQARADFLPVPSSGRDSMFTKLMSG